MVRQSRCFRLALRFEKIIQGIAPKMRQDEGSQICLFEFFVHLTLHDPVNVTLFGRSLLLLQW